MTTSPAPVIRQTTRRTSTLAAAVLASAILLSACVATPAHATDSSSSPTATPTSSATAQTTVTASPSPTASAEAEEAKPVVIGAGGVLIAMEDAATFELDGTTVAGELAAGERARWTAYSPLENSVGSYTLLDEHGEPGTVQDTRVFAFPKSGLPLDSPILIRSAIGKPDSLSGFGARLGVESMTVRAAPSKNSPVLKSIQPGQKYMASAVVTGQESLFGASKWLAVQLDGEGAYGFVRREATAIDPDPSGEEVLGSTTSTEAPSAGALDQPTAMGDDEAGEETASATPTASPSAAEAPTVEPAMEPAATEEKKDNSGLVIGGLGAALAALIGGMIFSANRRKKKADATAEPVSEKSETVADEAISEAPAVKSEETDVEVIDWDED